MCSLGAERFWARAATEEFEINPGRRERGSPGPIESKRSRVFVVYSGGNVVGTMPAGMNLAGFAAWSRDESWFVRLTLDETVEVYRF